MSRCAVCHLPGATPLVLASGKDIGAAHPDGCAGLLWEAHWHTAAKPTPYELAVFGWEWRRWVAVKNGRPFDEACPESPAEKQLNSWVRVRGLEDVARELE